MDADENLYSIVFGESIFNDAIGLVMFETVLNMGKTENLSTFQEVAYGAGRFITIFAGSVIIGTMLALIAAFILKRQTSYIQTEHDDDLDKPEEEKN